MKFNKLITISITVVLGLTYSLSAFGAESTQVHDEAMYVNLDYYGVPKQTSIVKSYSMNGTNTVTDYGTYKKVTNMSNYAKPTIKDGKVTFNFGKDVPDRFYFEGQDNALSKNLPWDIKVNYYLNGAPTTADKLAGKTGLVKIAMDVTPNKNVNEYEQNNFMLEATCAVDADKNTLSAEGAQIQSVGNIKTAVFFALPGEEQHFEVEIGSNDFKLDGIIFMMEPMTVSQIDKIKDLRDARDDIKDSADSISDSLDVVLDTLNSMQKGLNDTSKGLSGLNDARETLSKSKGGVYDSADAAREELTKLTDALKPYEGHFKTLKGAVDDVNSNITSVTSSLDALTTNLNGLKSNMENMKTDLSAIDDLITKEDADKDTWNSTLTKLNKDLDDVNTDFDATKAYLNGIKDAGNNLSDDINNITSSSEFSDLMNGLQYNYGAKGDINSGGIYSLLYTITYLSSDLADLSRNAGDLCGVLNDIVDKNDDADNIINDTQSLVDLTNKTIKNIYSHSDDYHSMISDATDVCDNISEMSDKLTGVIKSIDSFKVTSDKYKDELKKTADDSSNLVDRSSTELTLLQTFFTKLEDTAKTVGDKANVSSEETLLSLIDVLNKAVSGLSQTDVIKNSKDTMKKLADDKWDKYTGEDNNLFNVDNEAKMVSFTSNKNPEPSSLQILLKTDEIRKATEDDKNNVDESYHSKGNAFTRILSIFKNIFSSIKNIFNK
ncbi:MAG: hypothetical protein LKJ25_08815 [Clostridia bacterium]|jgi:putative membrane protein|nr:hypothetical protein [Clostridia bacterium]